MRGLFFKIFAIFWVAQSLIVIISTTLIVRQHFPNPGVVAESLDSNLRFTAQRALRSYETGGCAAFAADTQRFEPSGAELLDAQGSLLCSTPGAPVMTGLRPHFNERVESRQLSANHYLWLVPLTLPSGARASYVWFQPPSMRRPPKLSSALYHFMFPQLPVAIAVGGVTTFILVLLFSRPLVRLRKAARQLAEGDLSARVDEGASGSLNPRSDEFQGLVHDFNHMAERLESLVGAQRMLLRDVSHELRSPLARLSVALELAREDADPALVTHLERIEREGERLNQLIGQLLTLSSLEVRESTEHFEPVSLNELCEAILPDAEYEAQKRPCTIVLEQSDVCVIRGNAELLHRAIENVVRNAIRYTEPNTEIVVRIARESDGAGARAVVTITDCGPGILEQELEQIYQPFYRVDKARSASTGGFGVGLAIAERAVRLHGGTLVAKNRAQGGTQMTMSFPMS